MLSSNYLKAGLLSVLCGSGLPCLSQETRNQEQVIAARVPSGETGQESDHMTGSWGGFRDRMVERGVHVSAGYVGEFQSVVSGGARRGSAWEGIFETSLD